MIVRLSLLLMLIGSVVSVPAHAAGKAGSVGGPSTKNLGVIKGQPIVKHH